VNDHVGIIAEDPFPALVAFDAGGSLSDLLELELDLIRNGLQLLCVGAVADQKIVRKSGDFGEV
jgi:hypothetical protein